MLNVINISIYLASLYVINNNKLLGKLSIKYPFLIKIINFYNKTRLSFIILELGTLLGCIGYLIYFSIRIIVNLK